MSQEKVLIVEDDGILAAHLEDTLTNLGYEMLEPVATGEEAIERVRTGSPDLVIMDIELAGRMNGIAAAEKIGFFSDVPVIYLTGYSQDPLLEEAKITAPYGYLVKPVPERELAATIEMALYRRSLDRKLRESEERYRLLFQSHVAAIALHEIICDAEGSPRDYRFLEVNPAFEKLTGLRAESIVGRTVVEIMPDVETYWIEEYGKVALTGEAAHFEQYSKGLDKYFEVTCYRTEPGRFAVSFIDVTERKKAAETLGRANERFALATHAARMGVWDWDVQQNKLVWDDRMYELYGIRRQNFSGAYEAWLQGIHPDDRARSDEVSREALRGDREYDTGFRIVWPDGTVRILKAYGMIVRDDEGHPVRMTGVNYDVTEQKRAEEALQESEQRVKTLMDAAPVAISWSDMEGEVEFRNRKHKELFGYSDEDIPTVAEWRRRAYPDPAYRETIPNYLATQKEGKEFAPFEATVTCKDGTLRHVIVSGAAVSNRILYMLADVTERKRLEDQLRQAQKMEAVGTLAGGVAHDFNNILTVIMGLGNLMQMSIGSDDILRPYADQIVASSERAADLTQSLLAFSRKQRITLESHTVNGVVTSTAKLLTRLLPEDIKLTISLCEGDTSSLLDVSQVGQVLMNLATNARDAMPHGGSLTIKTHAALIDEAFIKAHGFGTVGEYVKLSVADSGVGMDPPTLARIFEPFFTTKEVGKGTGLGLASTYGIVKQHHGYITVESTPFSGTTFDIYLPLLQMPSRGEEKVGREIEGGNETILIVEDDRDVRYMLTSILESHGYVTIEASDGEQALEVHNAHKDRIDLIILDVVMPGKNGREVYDEIERTTPHVKAIFTSGYTGDIVIGKGIRSESVDFLRKPLTVTGLLTKVREVLDR